MTNHALSSAGAFILLATSSDEKHPAENVLDGDKKTYWMTTGMFPHVLIIKFRRAVLVKNVRIHCFDVKELLIETSDAFDGDYYEKLFQKELQRYGGALQIEDIPGENIRAGYMRITINSGYHQFVSIHSVCVEGELV